MLNYHGHILLRGVETYKAVLTYGEEEMTIKRFFKKLVYRHKATSEDYAMWLKSKGVRIGDGTNFIDPVTTLVDVTRPWMVEIGESCCITGGVTILTHDYGWSVIKAVYGEVIGSCGKVKIGDNVYIGMHTTIIAGVTIGNHVIVGANSVVTKDVPDNVVVAGNPAKIIRSLEAYHDKRKGLEVKEARDMAKEYYYVYGKVPPIEIMREHFWIFENKENNLQNEFIDVNNSVYKSEEKTRKQFAKHVPHFKSYEEFLEYVEIPYK